MSSRGHSSLSLHGKAHKLTTPLGAGAALLSAFVVALERHVYLSSSRLCSCVLHTREAGLARGSQVAALEGHAAKAAADVCDCHPCRGARHPRLPVFVQAGGEMQVPRHGFRPAGVGQGGVVKGIAVCPLPEEALPRRRPALHAPALPA